MRLGDGGWTSERHLFETFRNVCIDSGNLEEMEAPWLSRRSGTRFGRG